jgi:hypothetical protein
MSKDQESNFFFPKVGETTNAIETTRHRTFQAKESDKRPEYPFKTDYKNGAECFNDLSPYPAKNIDLGDGRELGITGWKPVGDIDDNFAGIVRIEITGMIRRRKEG